MLREGLRLCAACSIPSPGPAKRLYYQHRDYGPFFPILEDVRRKSNTCLYNGGRVVVCTSCASHLLRQWANYEKSWTPLEKRTYTLLSEERLARKAAQKDGLMSKVSMETNGEHVELQQDIQSSRIKPSNVKPNPKNRETRNQETSSSDKVISSRMNERLTPLSFISDDSSPFQRAVKKVSKQNTRILAEYNEGNKQPGSFNLDSLEKHEWNNEERTANEVAETTPRKRALALWNLPGEDIRTKVREELQENIDVMIRKVAEIQHFENMRRYEQELKEAADRMCRVQNRESDIDRMCQSLKAQLQEELLFRDTLRVLREGEKDLNGDKNVIMSIEAPPASRQEKHTEKRSTKPRITEVTDAKKTGKEWKEKTVRKKAKQKTVSGPTETSLALVPCPTEEGPGTRARNDAERITSATRKLDVVVRELEKEREWRKKTEDIIVQQREMIEELRSGIQGEVQRLIEEQNKRYQKIKENIGQYEPPRGKQSPGPRSSPNGQARPRSPNKKAYINMDRASPVDQDAVRRNGEKLRSRERRRRRKDRSRDEWLYQDDLPTAARNKKYDDDVGDGVMDDSDEEGSPLATPEYYIQ